MFGFVNLNKPRNFGSRTAINSVVKLVRPHKVGHTGTLDPLATGVLVTAVGPATRLSKFVQDARKCYRGTFRLGLTSDTEDITGNVESVAASSPISAEQLIAALPQFIGQITQTPPQYSALKIDGVRAYTLARRGIEANLKSRQVEIHRLMLTQFEYPNFEIEIECGGGTYIRTLGRDIAKSLGSDAVMTDLTRTAVGPFRLEDSVSSEGLTLETLQQSLVAPQAALRSFAQIKIGDSVVRQLQNAIPWTPTEAQDIDTIGDATEFLAVDRNQHLIAVMRCRGDGSGSYTPKLNFVHYWNEAE